MWPSPGIYDVTSCPLDNLTLATFLNAELGLADGIGHIEDILKNKFGEKTKIKIIEQKKSFLQRKLSSYSNRSLINTYEIIDAIEEKSYWTRFGL